MSAGSSIVNEIRQIYASFLQTEYCSVAARALFLWDFLITLPEEVSHVWAQPCSGAMILFFVNKYGALLITILELLEQAAFQNLQSCEVISRCLQSLLILQLFVVAVFSTLRVYATWGRDLRPAILILFPALIAPAGNIYIDVKSTPTMAAAPSFGCAVDLDMSLYTYSKLVIMCRAASIVSDGLVVICTIFRTVSTGALGSRWGSITEIGHVLVKDGSTYFLLLLVINITQVILAAEIAGNNMISYFVSPVTSMLISRLILNLRQIPTQSHDLHLRTDNLAFSSIYLTTINLGNLGEPLEHRSILERAEEWEDPHIQWSEGSELGCIAHTARAVDGVEEAHDLRTPEYLA